jgi:uncharacterized protein YjiS (DUF1127 family)
MAVGYRNIYDELDARGAVSWREAELKAQMARAEMAADLVIAAGRALRALVGRVLARRREAIARAELLAMSDRELADIGLNRGDVRRKNLGELAREASAPAAAPANRNEAPRRAA